MPKFFSRSIILIINQYIIQICKYIILCDNHRRNYSRIFECAILVFDFFLLSLFCYKKWVLCTNPLVSLSTHNSRWRYNCIQVVGIVILLLFIDRLMVQRSNYLRDSCFEHDLQLFIYLKWKWIFDAHHIDHYTSCTTSSLIIVGFFLFWHYCDVPWHTL